MKTDSLHKTLSHFKKADLVDILYYFGAPVPRISLKQTLVDSLYAYIGSHPREWLSRMLQRDILQLKRLCAQAPGEHILIPYPDNPSVLEVLGLVQSAAGMHASFALLAAIVVLETVMLGSSRTFRQA